MQTDSNGYGINLDQAGERFVYFTSGYDYTTGMGSDPDRADDNAIATEPNTRALADYELQNTGLVPTMSNLRVWVPPLPYHWANNPISKQSEPYASARRYFPARREREAGPITDLDVPLAPILPGRYAVVGPSGIQLNGTGNNPTVPSDGQSTQRFVSQLSRLTLPIATDSVEHRQTLQSTRRIELWPSTDPEEQQVLVAENGGPEFMRLGGTPVNVTDTNLDGIPDPGDLNNHNPAQRDASRNIIQPAVAIPVEDLNITEPVEGYPSRRYIELYLDRNKAQAGQSRFPNWSIDEQAYARTGEIMFNPPFDHPLDLDFELQGNRTTQNYRSIHLQRLANPMLPWNPPPLDDKGNVNPLHQRNLPINPYMTIDSQSVDLTAYNGATTLEREKLPTDNVARDAQLSGRLSKTAIFQSDLFAPLPARSLVDAPDHVLWALVYILKQEGVPAPATAAELRQELQNDPLKVEQQYLRRLEQNRQSPDLANRDELNARTCADQYGRDWGGEWGWSLYKRALPDDPTLKPDPTNPNFKQRLSLKSLERGAHDSIYYPKFTANSPEGWFYDTNWQPRLLWKQERPNVTLFLKDAGGNITRATDLVDATSKLVLSGKDPESRNARLSQLPPKPYPTPDADDMVQRNKAVWPLLRAATANVGENDHVVDFVLEQTLGFTNEAYAPELDRSTGDQTAMLTSVAPGAPEVAAGSSERAGAAARPEGNEHHAAAEGADQFAHRFDGCQQDAACARDREAPQTLDAIDLFLAALEQSAVHLGQ